MEGFTLLILLESKVVFRQISVSLTFSIVYNFGLLNGILDGSILNFSPEMDIHNL